eukprot:scaffold18669_cov60-Phaeocystis_antarctica.AAC.1
MANTSMLCHHCVDHHTSATTLSGLGQAPGAPPAKRPLTAVGRSGSKSISVRRPLQPWRQWSYRASALADVYWGNVHSMGFEVQSSTCAQDPRATDAWTAAKVAGFATFSGAASQLSQLKYTKTFDGALTGRRSGSL